MKTQKDIDAITAKIEQLISNARDILADKEAGAFESPTRAARLNGRIDALETVLKLIK